MPTTTHTAPTTPRGGENYRLVVPSTATAPRLARDFVGSLLCDGAHTALADDARLCVTELVTNAHRHTRTRRIRLDAAVNRKQVTIYVADDNPWALPTPNTPRPPGLDADRGAGAEQVDGRGLFLVQSLALAWGSIIYGGCEPSHKAVWFTLARDKAAA